MKLKTIANFRRTGFAALVVIGSMMPLSVATAQDMDLSAVLIDGESWQLVAEGFKFTEGPAVDAQGNLFFTDIPNNRIHRVDTAGKLSVFAEQTNAANGLMFGSDGRLYACQNGAKRIVAYDPQGQSTTIVEGLSSNDLVVMSDRSLYVTDPENSQVWHVARGEKRVVDRGIQRPNGIILWPDQQTLVVADTAGAHLWTFRIEPDGSLSHKSPYYTMQLPAGRKESGADGMTVDRQGRLYVTTQVGLQMFDPTGRLGGAIVKPERGKWISNVCFGGLERDVLYVTATDKVYRRKVQANGVVGGK